MSTLPPLIFKGEEPYDVWHPLKIAYEIREDQRTPAYPYSSRTSHPTGLFGCLRMDKCGINCCCAHCCCCQPCTWADAMKVAGIQGAGAAAFSRIVARAIPRDSDAGKIIGGVAEADASFAGAAVRRKLSDKLFDEQTEGYWTGIFYHCCCTPCAYCQETNAVIVWAREKYGNKNDITYGSVLSCECCYMVEQFNTDRIVCSVPFEQSTAPSRSMV